MCLRKIYSRVGQTFGVPPDQRYADYRDMLANAEIDVVTVATPHFLHAEHAIEAASAGRGSHIGKTDGGLIGGG